MSLWLRPGDRNMILFINNPKPQTKILVNMLGHLFSNLNQFTPIDLKMKKVLVIKMYMLITFDRVGHSFLYKVIHKFGFTPQFVGSIKSYIKELWISPLENGRF